MTKSIWFWITSLGSFFLYCVSAINDLLFLFCYILRFEFLMLSNEMSFCSHIIPEIAFYICSTAQLWFWLGSVLSLNINFPMLSSNFLCCVFPEYTIKLLVSFSIIFEDLAMKALVPLLIVISLPTTATTQALSH